MGTKTNITNNPISIIAQEFIDLLGRNEIIGPFTDAIDQSIQIQIQTDFLSFIIEESKEFPPKDIETEFAKLGFDYSDFDQILKVFGQAFVGMPAGEPERCLKVIETHKSLFLGENLDKSFGLSIIGGVKKLDLIAANCVAEARQFPEYASVFNLDANHEHFITKFLAYALEVPKLTPKMKESLVSLKSNLGFSDKHTAGMLRILHDVLKQLNIDPHYGGLMEDRITNYQAELLEFETIIVEEISKGEELVYKDMYLIESIGGESVIPEIVSLFYTIISENPKIGYLFHTDYKKSQAQTQSVFLLSALSSTPLSPFFKYSMEYFHSRYPITVADYSKIQEAYILAFRSQRIQEVLIDMCLDKIDSQKHFYTTEALVKTSGSSIYKEIGGFKEVKKLTEIFLSKLNSDSEMGSYFCVVAAPLLGNYLTQFVCVLLDNETMNSATRERLKNTHRSLNIQDKAFNRTKEAMRTTLRELNIRPEMEERIMEKLETARQEITCKGDLGDFGRELSERDSVRKRFSVRNSVSGTAPNFSKDQEERQQKSGGFLALLRKTPSMNRKQVDPLTISKKQSDILDSSKTSASSDKTRSAIVAAERKSRRNSVTESIMTMMRKISITSTESPLTPSKASDLSEGSSDKSRNELSPQSSGIFPSNSTQGITTNFRRSSSNSTNKRPSKNRSASVSQNRPDIKDVIAEDISASGKAIDFDAFSPSANTTFKAKDSVSKKLLKEDLPPLPKRNLYESIGGEEAIFEMVEQWGELVQNDTIIGPFFVKSNMIKIKATQKRILTMLLTQDAIPEKDAKTIGMAHSKLRLTNDHFDRMLALFRKAFIDTGASLDLSKEAINCIEKSRSLVVSESSKKCDWAE